MTPFLSESSVLFVNPMLLRVNDVVDENIPNPPLLRLEYIGISPEEVMPRLAWPMPTYSLISFPPEVMVRDAF